MSFDEQPDGDIHGEWPSPKRYLSSGTPRTCAGSSSTTRIRAADIMRCKEIIERLAQFEPDIEVEPGEN